MYQAIFVALRTFWVIFSIIGSLLAAYPSSYTAGKVFKAVMLSCDVMQVIFDLFWYEYFTPDSLRFFVVELYRKRRLNYEHVSESYLNLKG